MLPEAEMAPRDLAALASALLLIDDARIYGLIDGGPDVNRSRCEEVLEQLSADGIEPSEEEVGSKILGLLCEMGAVRG